MKLTNVTNLDQIKELIRNETNKEPYALTIYRDFIEFTGNRNGALVLQELCYWSTNKSESGGWFYQPFEPASDGSSSTSWRQNTYLNEKTVRQWLTAFQELGIIETARHRVGPKGTPRAFYRVVWDKFLPNLLDFLKSGFSVVKETIKNIRDNLRERRIKRQAEKEAQQNVSVIEPEVKEAEVNMFEEPVATVETDCDLFEDFKTDYQTPLFFTESNNEISVENTEVLVEEKVDDQVCDHIDQVDDHVLQVESAAIITTTKELTERQLMNLLADTYNENKPVGYKRIESIFTSREKVMRAFIKECKKLKLDPVEVMTLHCKYLNNDSYWQNLTLTFENIMTKGKPFQFYEAQLADDERGFKLTEQKMQSLRFKYTFEQVKAERAAEESQRVEPKTDTGMDFYRNIFLKDKEDSDRGWRSGIAKVG